MRWLLRILLLGCLNVWLGVGWAQSAEVIVAPSNQSNQYRVMPRVVTGVPRELQVSYQMGVFWAHLEWQQRASEYAVKLNAMGKKIAWRSEGKIEAQRVLPQQFTDVRNGVSPPKGEVKFDWSRSVVQQTGVVEDVTLTGGEQDIASLLLHLARSPKSSEMTIFTGNRRYEKVSFTAQGEQILRIGNIEINAVLMHAAWEDRQIDVWLAPQWGNAPIRLHLLLGKEGAFDVWANEVSLDGKTVFERISR